MDTQINIAKPIQPGQIYEQAQETPKGVDPAIRLFTKALTPPPVKWLSFKE